jgi:hypothetical protein
METSGCWSKKYPNAEVSEKLRYPKSPPGYTATTLD